MKNFPVHHVLNPPKTLKQKTNSPSYLHTSYTRFFGFSWVAERGGKSVAKVTWGRTAGLTGRGVIAPAICEYDVIRGGWKVLGPATAAGLASLGRGLACAAPEGNGTDTLGEGDTGVTKPAYGVSWGCNGGAGVAISGRQTSLKSSSCWEISCWRSLAFSLFFWLGRQMEDR